MDLNTMLKRIEKEIEEEKVLFGDAYELTFQSYSTYAVAVQVTEAYMRASGVMSSEEFTEKRLRDELLNLAKVCIRASTLINTGEGEEETEGEEERSKKRTIGFRVADKEDGYKEDDTPPYPHDTYAVGYEIPDEEYFYEEEDY